MLRSDSARKRAINLSLNANRLDSACEPGMNLPQPVDPPRPEEHRRRQAEAWLNRDSAATDAYDARVKKVGMWNRSLRISRGSI